MKKFLIITLLGFLVLTGCSQNTSVNNSNDDSNGITLQFGSASKNNKNINTNKMPDTLNQEKPEYTQATINTNLGSFTVEFFGDDSPATVNNFIKLAKDGFYDGTKFHRVIKDFMIQGGDPLSKDESLKDRWGTGGPGYTFEDEFNVHKLVKGSLAMANAGPNTNGSQFFIVTAEATPWLDGKHTNFGEVISGLDVVEKIEKVETEGPDRPVESVEILSIDLIEE